MIEYILFGPLILSAYNPDWVENLDSDDDESYPPHLNEELESDQSDS